MAQEIFTTSLLTDPNLRGYWRFENNVTDSSSDGYNLTTSGGPGYAAGQFGNAISLAKASSQFAAIASASCPNLGGTGSFTIITWVKPSTHTSLGIIAGKRGNANNGWILYENTDGTVQLTVDGLTGGNAQSAGTLTDSTIYRITGRYDSVGGTVAVWINKTKTNTAGVTGTRSTNSVGFAVGADYQGGGDTSTLYFDGIIDDVAYFDRVVNDGDLDALYDGSYGLGRDARAFFV